MNRPVPNDKRTRKNMNSVLSLIALLEEVNANPDEFIQDDKLFQVLKKQSDCYNYRNDEKGIVGCSLNTVKGICRKWLYYEFKNLDALRITAYDKLLEAKASKSKPKSKSKSNKRSRAGLALQNSQFQNQISILKQTNFLLIKCCIDAIGDIEAIASAGGESVRTVRAKEAIDKIRTILSQNVELPDAQSVDVHILSR